MPPDRIEEMFADVTAKRIDTAELQLQQLKLKLVSLQTRLNNLLQKAEHRQIEIAESADLDAPMQKSEVSSHQQEINDLLHILAEEYAKEEPKLAQTHAKLEAAETRIQSLEALFPGGAENN